MATPAMTAQRWRLALIVMASWCLADATRAEEYENLTHRFKLSIPDGFTACIDEHANDHGVIIHPDMVRCAGASTGSSGKFWAAFNLPDEIKDIETLRNTVCEDRGQVSDITFGGLELWPCQQEREAGRVVETFLGLRAAPGGDAGLWRQVGIAIEAPAADFPNFREKIKDIAARIVLVEPLE